MKTASAQTRPDQTQTPRAEQIEVLQSGLLRGQSGLVHGFSTRTGGVSTVYRGGLPGAGGDLNLGYTAHDDPAHVRENRRRFLQAGNGTGMRRFALLRQEHTPNVHVIERPEDLPQDFGQPGTLPGDGLITEVPGVLLAIGTADCVPVLVYDPRRRVVAAFHAGWRGTVARIVEHGVARMCAQFGCCPDNLLAAIGPGIGPASYVVSQDVRIAFESAFPYAAELFTEATPATGKPASQVRLNLWEANRVQLLSAGLHAHLIDTLAIDTATATDRFFSYRAEAGVTGRMLSVIGLTD